MAVLCGVDKARLDVFLNMVLVSGVIVSSYGEIHFIIVGTLYQVTGILAEVLKLVLSPFTKEGLDSKSYCQLLLHSSMRFYVYLLEKPMMEVSKIRFNFWIFFSNALCACRYSYVAFGKKYKDWKLEKKSSDIFNPNNINDNNGGNIESEPHIDE